MGEGLGTVIQAKKLTDPEDITAEAFAQDVLGDEVSWEEGLAQVTAIISSRDAGGSGSGNWGHEGRPGDVGGSGPGGSVTPKDRSDRAQARLKEVGDQLTAKGVDLNPAVLQYPKSGYGMPTSNLDPGYGSYGQSVQQITLAGTQQSLDQAVADGRISQQEKDEYIKAYATSEKMRIEGDDAYYEVQRVEIANSWKQSSASYGSTHMKEVARRDFGTEGIIYNPGNYSIHELEVARTSAMMGRMYRETQEDVVQEFKMGIPNPDPMGKGFSTPGEQNWDGKNITLYRGMKGNKGVAGALESWSDRRDSARGFGRTRKKSFKRTQILTYHRSKTWRGKGALQAHEYEYIIIRGVK
jgi:hypothetical protein